jgi:hypothetical protein
MNSTPRTNQIQLSPTSFGLEKIKDDLKNISMNSIVSQQTIKIFSEYFKNEDKVYDCGDTILKVMTKLIINL